MLLVRYNCFSRSDEYRKFPSSRFPCSVLSPSRPANRILRDPGAASRDDAIFSGENLLQEHQFQKCSNSVPLISQKKTFFWPISEEFQSGVVFLIDRISCLTREDSRKKDSAKLRKSEAVTPAQVYNIRRSIFRADLSEVYRKICIAVRDFYTVAGGDRSLQSLKY